MTACNAGKIAEILGISLRAVQKRAKKEAWPHTTDGRTKLYALDALPESVRIAIIAATSRDAVQAEESTALAVAQAAPVARNLRPQAAPVRKSPLADPTLTIPLKQTALAKADLVRLYTEAVRSASNKLQAKESFILAYSAGAWPALLEKIGPISWKTLERWKVTLGRQRDAFQLADRRGMHRRGLCSLTDDMQMAVLRLALHPNRVRVSSCIRMAREMLSAQGVQNLPSEPTFRRFLKNFESLNRAVWVFCREGAKAWNDKVAAYVDRDLSVLQVGDILVADGHRLNFQTIHPDTGRPCRMTLVVWYDMASNYPLGWELAPEENTQVIAAALRRALLRLGKPARIAYLDNGRAFKGSHFTSSFETSGVSGLFERLGMQTIFAWAYHGQSKTVERWFGYLRELEELAPAATGSCIEMKPAYQKRGEFAHRAIWEASGQRPMTMEETHQAIAAWVDYYASRPQQRSHLKGRTPQEVFEAGRGDGLSEEHLLNLRECMLHTTPRQVDRCQVTLPGSLVGSPKPIVYFDQALYGRKHQVFVRYDPQDLSRVEVHDQNWEYICTAQLKAKVHPAAKLLGSDEDQKLLALNLEMRKQAEKMAGGTAKELLQGEIMPGYTASLEHVGLKPLPEAKRPPLPTAVEPESLSDDEFAARMDELAQLNAEPAEELQTEPDYTPYVITEAEQFWLNVRGTWPESNRYEALLEAEAKGMLIPAEFAAFMRYFEQTKEYQGYREYFDELRMRLAMTYAVPQTEVHQGV